MRQQSMRLSPAAGALSGQFGKGKAKYRILVLGDSSVAAVGVDNTEGAFAPQYARGLHDQTGDTVAWRMSGHNSAVAGQIRDVVVPNLEPENYTHIVLLIGTNDMKNFHSVRRWKKEFGGLLYALRTRFPEAKVFWHQAIDLSVAPALPQPLATMLNWRRLLLNRMGAQLCVERGAVVVPPLQGATAEGFCRDGFHANESGYRAWAEHMLDHIDETPRSSPAALPYT